MIPQENIFFTATSKHYAAADLSGVRWSKESGRAGKRDLYDLKILPHFFHVLFIGYIEFLYALSFFRNDNPMIRNLKY